MAVIPGTHLEDVSEFQSVDWDAYGQVRNAAIIRFGYGDAHPDGQWAHNQASRGRFKVLGIYLYFVAGEDAAAQANYFADGIGALKDGEFLILDDEEGSGDQQGRLAAALAILDARMQRETGEYSYVPFIEAHLAGFESDGPRLRWIAGYGPEPSIPWDLWQHTDGVNGNHECQPAYPGGPVCDCSVFRGTVDQLYALVMGTPAAAPPPPPLPPTQTYPEDAMVRHPLTVAVASGNGYADLPDVPFANVVGLFPNAADPQTNEKYVSIPKVAPLQEGAGTRVVVEMGDPTFSGPVLVFVATAA